MSRNYNELLLDKNTDDEVPLYSIFQFDGNGRRIPTTLRVSAYR